MHRRCNISEKEGRTGCPTNNGNRERVIPRTLRFVATPEDRFSRIIFCRIRSGFICRIIVTCLVVVGPPLHAFGQREANEPFADSRTISTPGLNLRGWQGTVMFTAALREKFGKVTWGVWFSRPRRRPSSLDSSSVGFEDEDDGRWTRTAKGQQYACCPSPISALAMNRSKISLRLPLGYEWPPR